MIRSTTATFLLCGTVVIGGGFAVENTNIEISIAAERNIYVSGRVVGGMEAIRPVDRPAGGREVSVYASSGATVAFSSCGDSEAAEQRTNRQGRPGR
jgi:hypothetical protein